MQIQITLEPKQEANFDLAEVLRAFATNYETRMIRSTKCGKHTLHDESGELIASLEIMEGADFERSSSKEADIASHHRKAAAGIIASCAFLNLLPAPPTAEPER